MPRINQGICPKDSKGNRLHKNVIKTDSVGNKFIACIECGCCPVVVEHIKVREFETIE